MSNRGRVKLQRKKDAGKTKNDIHTSLAPLTNPVASSTQQGAASLLSKPKNRSEVRWRRPGDGQDASRVIRLGTCTTTSAFPSPTPEENINPALSCKNGIRPTKRGKSRETRQPGSRPSTSPEPPKTTRAGQNCTTTRIRATPAAPAPADVR